jgi:hypothetical protein
MPDQTWAGTVELKLADFDRVSAFKFWPQIRVKEIDTMAVISHLYKIEYVVLLNIMHG